MSRCGCGCGSCNKNISYGHNKSCNKAYAGIYFCKDPLSYVKANFIVPADNVILEIEVTDSSRLYVGEGIQIGTGYFQVIAIEDATNISIAQNGTATVGLQITAIHPSYGCYQYPMLYVGAVDRLIAPTVIGVDSSFAEVADSVLSQVTQLTFSYLGPYKVEFEFELSCTIDNAPQYVEVELPVAVGAGAPQATFSVMVDDGSGFAPAIAYRDSTTTFVIGIDAATALSDGADRVFRVTGIYDLQ